VSQQAGVLDDDINEAFASVVFGLLISTRLTDGRPTASWLTGMHRYLGALTIGTTALHVGAGIL